MALADQEQAIVLNRNLSIDWAVVCAAAVLVASVALVDAQNPTMLGHPEDYPRVDIEHGARLYAENCDRCHGANGNGVSGVDLRSGRFRNAVSDQDLARVITNGIPATGMLGFKFDAAELTGVVAYLRNMNSFDRESVKTGDAARGRNVFEGRGGCPRCHRVGTQGPVPFMASALAGSTNRTPTLEVRARTCAPARLTCVVQWGVAPRAPVQGLTRHRRCRRPEV